MISFLHKRPKHCMTARGERVYAIGDIHGRYDLLKRLLNLIVKHWESSDGKFKHVKLLFLGDIIDRGDHSQECLQMVTNLVLKSQSILLRGNHEDLLLRSVKGDAQAQHLWLEHGGLATLKSFGVEPPRAEEDCIDFGERISQAIAPDLISVLENAPTHFSSGDYFFVHAGVRPGVTLKKQTDYDKFFIRDEFTQSNDWHGAMIVHGHSIVDKVDFFPNRIAIDTGAYKTDKLSCLCLDGRRRQVLTT